MYTVYILYSASSKRTYVGYTNNLQRRLVEHNHTEQSGFTLRYRPWTLLHTEEFATKQEAMLKEKFLKTGTGRKLIKEVIFKYTISSK